MMNREPRKRTLSQKSLEMSENAFVYDDDDELERALAESKLLSKAREQRRLR